MSCSSSVSLPPYPHFGRLLYPSSPPSASVDLGASRSATFFTRSSLSVRPFGSEGVVVLFPSQQSDRSPSLPAVLPSFLPSDIAQPSEQAGHEAYPLQFNAAGCGQVRGARGLEEAGAPMIPQNASHRVRDSDRRSHATSLMTLPRRLVWEAAPPGGAIHVIAVISPSLPPLLLLFLFTCRRRRPISIGASLLPP